MDVEENNMNREILFRGKRIDNCEWVEGVYFPSKDGDALICTNIVAGTPVDETGMCIVWTVDPNTVGQWTCLIDKNGKKIFEGDICRENSGDKSTLVYLGREELANHIGVVKFGIHQVPSDDPYVWGEAYGFFLSGGVDTPAISTYRPEEDNYGNGLELDVIGNIYDNPELIDGEQDV